MDKVAGIDVDADAEIAIQIARAAIAAYSAEQWYDDHWRESDSNPSTQLTAYKDQAILARDSAINYALGDDDGRKVRECADSAVQALDRCRAAAKATNDILERMAAPA